MALPCVVYEISKIWVPRNVRISFGPVVRFCGRISRSLKRFLFTQSGLRLSCSHNILATLLRAWQNESCQPAIDRCDRRKSSANDPREWPARDFEPRLGICKDVGTECPVNAQLPTRNSMLRGLPIWRRHVQQCNFVRKPCCKGLERNLWGSCPLLQNKTWQMWHESWPNLLGVRSHHIYLSNDQNARVLSTSFGQHGLGSSEFFGQEFDCFECDCFQIYGDHGPVQSPEHGQLTVVGCILLLCSWTITRRRIICNSSNDWFSSARTCEHSLKHRWHQL